MATIFIDESGLFIERGSERYFIIASFAVDDPKRTAKRFKAWCQTKFPRKMRALAEVKYSGSGIDQALRLRTLRFICSLEVRIRFVYFKCENFPTKYMYKSIVQGGLLYTHMVGKVIEQYFPSNDKEFFVICDQRRLKGVTDVEFKEMLTTKIYKDALPGTKVRIDRVDSATDRNIQIVDWIAGALAAYLNEKPLGQECMDILKDNIVGTGIELFA